MMKKVINTPIFAIYHFFWGKPINFYSPYTLDETFQYLQNESELDKQKSVMWRFIRIILTGRGRDFKLIKLESISSTSYRFIVKRDVARNMSINTYGQVEEADLGVKVIGNVQVDLITRLFILIGLVVWVAVILIPIQIVMSDVFPFAIVIIGIFLISIMADQNKMYNTIHTILGESRVENSKGYANSIGNS